jgi:3-oxosteroid 1-dehydrogenase
VILTIFAGGKKYGGRSIEGRVFDLKQLGPWMDKLNMNPQFKGVPMYTHESAKLFRTTTLAGIQTAMKVFIWRRTGQQLLGRTPVTLGPTLTGQLLLLTVKNDIPIWLNTPMKDIVVEDGVVTGVLVEKDNETVLVEAKKGVLLAAGGFAHNAAMRQKYQENPITSDWTLVPQGIDDNPPADQGDAITVAMKAGAATALMDDAWWGPTILDPREKNKRHWCHTERALPHSVSDA